MSENEIQNRVQYNFKQYTWKNFRSIFKNKVKKSYPYLPDFQTVSRCTGNAVYSKILARLMR